MSLLNVRLDAEDAAKARELRQQGVQISQLVRQAIRQEHRRRRRTMTPAEAEAVLERIYAEHPLPPNLPPPVDITDRAAFREHVAKRLKRGRT